MVNTTWTLLVEGECSECKGKGHTDIIFSHCRQCGEHWTITPDTGIVLDGETAPCGCDWLYYHEEDFCHECCGTGKVKKQISLDELKQVLNG